jgi:hypothetical protein
MEQGNLSNVEWFRGIGEYKIDWGPGYRIYLAKDGLKIIGWWEQEAAAARHRSGGFLVGRLQAAQVANTERNVIWH